MILTPDDSRALPKLNDCKPNLAGHISHSGIKHMTGGGIFRLVLCAKLKLLRQYYHDVNYQNERGLLTSGY